MGGPAVYRRQAISVDGRRNIRLPTSPLRGTEPRIDMQSTSRLAREAHDTLLRYLNETTAVLATPDPFLKRIARRLVPAPLRPVVRRAATDLFILREQR